MLLLVMHLGVQAIHKLTFTFLDLKFQQVLYQIQMT